MINYQVPDHLLDQVVQVALSYPGNDVRRLNDIRAWRENLRLYLIQVASEAWVMGAQWAMDRQAGAKYMIVTPEQYEVLKEQADETG